MGSNASILDRRGLAIHAWEAKCCNGTYGNNIAYHMVLYNSSHFQRINSIVFLQRYAHYQNQTNNLDRSIEDVMNHFVYEPKKSTAVSQPESAVDLSS
jgi:hypothetical protein